jgi:hypothetical protein
MSPDMTDLASIALLGGIFTLFIDSLCLLGFIDSGESRGVFEVSHPLPKMMAKILIHEDAKHG